MGEVAILTQHQTAEPAGEQVPATVSLGVALRFWLLLGLISFGGPAGQIALMQTELVDRRHWISQRRFTKALNFCLVLPGPEAQQLATYLGWLLHGTRGGVLAGVLFVLPSLFILAGLAWVYLAFGALPVVAGIFYGIKPAVVAVVCHAVQRLGRRALRHRALWAIAVAAFSAVFFLHVGFPWVLAGAALLGLAGARLTPGVWADPSPPAVAAALIDDHTPRSAHTYFKWGRALRVVLVGAVLWLLPMALLVWLTGWTSTFTQMAWFFTKAALLTFGGAYAVLPYVYQSAVVNYHWVTPTQMIDGLALGETTPGPLIMVVAFVGFVAAYVEGSFGVDARPLAGALGAALATWFTFLPSFVFISLGAPWVESSFEAWQFDAPLAAIAAAVVGVMTNLAVFFVGQVLWPQGWTVAPDGTAMLIAGLTLLGLLRFKLKVTHAIAASALCGWGAQALGLVGRGL